MRNGRSTPRRVRVVCVAEDGRLLLLKWQDPTDGHFVWEPPGGGIDPDETPLAAARRELREETGLRLALCARESIPVARDVIWAGVRHRHLEAFFLGRLPRTVDIDASLHTEAERREYRGHAWVERRRLRTLEGQLEPPNLDDIVSELVGGRPRPRLR